MKKRCIDCIEQIFITTIKGVPKWYCEHPKHPDKKIGSLKLLNRGKRGCSIDDIPRKGIPRWCPDKVILTEGGQAHG